MSTLSNDAIEQLKTRARRETWDESAVFNAYDMSGGNFDDAYYGGQRDGKTQLARDILTGLGISWE